MIQMFGGQQLIINKIAESQSNQYNIDCSNQMDTVECKLANTETLYLFSTIETIKNFIAFIISPSLGRMADVYGRLPFIWYFAIITLITQVYLMMVAYWDFSYYIYFLLNSIATIFPQQTIVFMMISDKTINQHRLSMFGLVFLVVFACLPIVSILMSALGLNITLTFMIIFNISSFVFLMFLNETLENEHQDENHSYINPLTNLSLFFRNTTFISLGLVLFLTYIGQEGFLNIIKFYCFDVLDFTYNDLTMIFVALSLSSIFFNTPYVSTYINSSISNKNLLMMIVFNGIITHILMGIVNDKYLFAISVFANGFSVLSTPNIMAIKSNLCPDNEQGLIQGAIGGITSLAKCIGPFLFSWSYKYLGKRTPFWEYSGLYAVSLVIIYFGINLKEEDKTGVYHLEFESTNGLSKEQPGYEMLNETEVINQSDLKIQEN